MFRDVANQFDCIPFLCQCKLTFRSDITVADHVKYRRIFDSLFFNNGEVIV